MGSPRRYQKFIELLKILNSSDLIAVWSISEDWFDLCVDKQGGGEYDTSQETKNWDGECLYEKWFLRTAVLFSLNNPLKTESTHWFCADLRTTGIDNEEKSMRKCLIN